MSIENISFAKQRAVRRQIDRELTMIVSDRAGAELAKTVIPLGFRGWLHRCFYLHEASLTGFGAGTAQSENHHVAFGFCGEMGG